MRRYAFHGKQGRTWGAPCAFDAVVCGRVGLNFNMHARCLHERFFRCAGCAPDGTAGFRC